MPYLRSHSHAALAVLQGVDLNYPEIHYMSYQVLSLNTRSKIVRFNHQALQHFSLHISLCYHLAPASLVATASHSQHIHSLATKPQNQQNEPLLSSRQTHLYKPHGHLLQHLHKSLETGCQGMTRSLPGQPIISAKHLAGRSGGKGTKSSDTYSNHKGLGHREIIGYLCS